MRFVILVFLVCCFTSQANARVFDFESNSISPYLRGTGGISNLGTDPYGKTSGDTTYFSEEVPYNISAEFGVSFQLGEKIVIRTAIEGLQSKSVVAEGTRESDGERYMDVESQVRVFNPKLVFEFNLDREQEDRTFGYLGVGYSTVKVVNEYNLEALAQGQYNMPGIDAYKDSWEGSAISYNIGVGYETHLLDNVSITFDGGYRILEVEEFKYSSGGRQIEGNTSAVVAEGDTVYADDGRKMTLDLNGIYVGVTLRFYIPSI